MHYKENAEKIKENVRIWSETIKNVKIELRIDGIKCIQNVEGHRETNGKN